MKVIIFITLVVLANSINLHCQTKLDSMKTEKVKKKDVKDLINNENVKLDSSLTDIADFDAYILEDNRVLFVLDEGDGIIYQSTEHVYEILNIAAESTEYDYHQIEINDSIIKKSKLILESRFELGTNQIDKNFLSQIDVHLNKHGVVFDKELISSLIVVCGEAFINAYGGIWKVITENGQNKKVIEYNGIYVFDIIQELLELIADGEDIKTTDLVYKR